MKRIIILLLVAFSVCASAQQKFPVFMEVSQFQEDEFHNRVEFYYSIPDTMMIYKQKGGAYLGEVYLLLEFKAQNEAQPNYVKWIVENQSETAKKQSAGLLCSQKTVVLNKGAYQCKLYVYDFNDTTKNVVLPFDLQVEPFGKSKPLISNVEMVQSKLTSDEAGPTRNKAFDKAGMNLVPIPTCLVSCDSTNSVNVHFYTELYNLGKYTPAGHRMVYTLSNENSEVMSFSKDAKTAFDAICDVVTIPMEFMQSGTYRLDIKCLYPAGKFSDTVLTSKVFSFFNPLMPPVRQDVAPVEYEKSEFAALTAEQLEDEYILLGYFGEETDLSKYNILKNDLVACRKLLYDFWIALQAKNPQRPNIRESVKENMKFANLNFAFSARQKGWKTDRGRIYVKYGPCTHRELHQPRQLQNAYEVWTYDAYEGGLAFYFVDKEAIDNFKLVHCSSTSVNEVYNENWYKMFVTPRQQDINGSDSNNSRSLPTRK
jgi:GWxTD domain-containing protein